MTDPHEIEQERETEGPVQGAAHIIAMDQLIQTPPRAEIENESGALFVTQTAEETVDVFMSQRTQLKRTTLLTELCNYPH